MSKIKVLDTILINKIAAGEVVERPSSIIRELLDNSIDAKSDKIDIFIENGGITKLVVQDNGIGISKEDQKKAILRHATSKISTENDLFSINTLGFRGEALPSIASVSKFEIISRERCSDIGYSIKIEGGNIIDQTPIATNYGTKIVVKDLFYNVPVRKKFLKREQTEFSYIYDVISKYLLFYSEIAFTIYKNGKKYKQYPSQTEKERVYSIFGKDIASKLYPLNLDVENFKISGFVGDPELRYKNSKNLHIFVNGRSIRDRVIQHAISHGYTSLLDQREYPFVILFFQIDPALVDINVHPQKAEVRFKDSRKVHTIISRTISETLSETPWVKREIKSFSSNQDSDFNKNIFNTFGGSNSGFKNISEFDYFQKSPNSGDQNGVKNLFSSDFIARSVEAKEQIIENFTGYFSNLKVIGQLMDTYILTEDSEGLVIIDQHAAHERVGYEKLLKGYNSKKPTIETLLVPIIIELTGEKFEVFMQYQTFFQEMGFDIEHFGDNSIAIRKIPSIFNSKRVKIEKMVIEIIDDYFKTGFSLEYDEKKKEIFSTMACHSVVRGGDRLNNSEIKALLELMDRIDFSSNCPHGRPVYYKISKYDLEKKFHRV